MAVRKAHKYLFATLVGVLSTHALRAQNSSPIFTQQLLNTVNLNPASVRPDPLVDVSLFTRMQWLGFKDAQRGIMLNASGYLPEVKSGISGSIWGEMMGIANTLNVKLGYSYHIHLGRMNYLAFGLNGGFLYKTFAGSKLKAEDEIDERLKREDVYSIKPDVDFGIMLTLNRFSIGVSATHLTAWAYNREKDYFAPHEGYHAFMRVKGDISPNFAIDPYIAAQYVNGSLKLEGVLKMRIADVFWIGAGYRHDEAVVAMAGAKIKDLFSIGYSYDLGMGGMRKYHTGSHEIFISLKFETTRKIGEVTDTPLMFE